MPAEMKKCYGKRKTCASACELAEYCREEWQIADAERKYNNNKNTLNDCGVPGGQNPAPEMRVNWSAIPEPLRLKVQNFIAEERKKAQLELAQSYAELFFYKPSTLEKIMLEIWQGKNQSDIAREQGVTRAAISKRLQEEDKVRLKREIQKLREQNAFFATMTPRELQVYQLRFVDGCTEKSIAQKLNLSLRRVQQISYCLRSKCNDTLRISARKKRKIRKILESLQKSKRQNKRGE